MTKATFVGLADHFGFVPSLGTLWTREPLICSEANGSRVARPYLSIVVASRNDDYAGGQEHVGLISIMVDY
eukprot:3834034-Amphidinium_carterae.1